MIGFAVASHRPIDVLEPMAGMHGLFACSPNALSSWAMATGAGGRCIYARAARVGGSLAERARLLSRAGSIQINQSRNATDASVFDFIATRTSKPITIATTAIDKVPTFAIELLDLLEAVAARGLSCPTNPQLAAALGGVPSHRITAALGQLQGAGLVTVEIARTGNDGRRTIKILETGETLCAA
jgi:hypothetical protein